MFLGLRSSLTVSPQTSTERPSAKILKPSTNRLTTAFSSRWWSVLQFGHCQRSCNLSSTFLTWQMQHNFDDGKNVSTLTSVRPYHVHLYSSMRMKSPNPASEITRARRPFLASRRHPDLATEGCGFESMATCLLRLDRVERHR